MVNGVSGVFAVFPKVCLDFTSEDEVMRDIWHALQTGVHGQLNGLYVCAAQVRTLDFQHSFFVREVVQHDYVLKRTTWVDPLKSPSYAADYIPEQRGNNSRHEYAVSFLTLTIIGALLYRCAINK